MEGGPGTAFVAPLTFKELLELFGRLGLASDACRKLEEKLGVIRYPLDSNSKTSDLQSILYTVADLYEALVHNPNYGKYANLNLNCCTDENFNKILRSFQVLYDCLRLLYFHVSGESSTVGLHDWSDQSSTKSTDELYRWLTDDCKGKYATLGPLPGGFISSDLKAVTGRDIKKMLSFMETSGLFPQFMMATMERRPSPPRTAGEMVTFLTRLSDRLHQHGGNSTQTIESALKVTHPHMNPVDLLAKLRVVSPTLTALNCELTPVNGKIQKSTPSEYMGIYTSSLAPVTVGLIASLKRMEVSISRWPINSIVADDPRDSLYYYGFQSKSANLKTKLPPILKKLMRELLEIAKLLGTDQMLMVPDDDYHIYQQVLSESEGGLSRLNNNVLCIILGVVIALAMGVIAYALNLCGCRNMMRGSSGRAAPPAASMRS